MKENNITLCGLPTSGKTTIGMMLATELNWNFIDSDSLIEKAYQKKNGKLLSYRQIARAHGEAYFRALEEEQLATLTSSNIRQTVIALGGGSLGHGSYRSKLQRLGYMVYLKASIDILWTRITERGLPSYLPLCDPFSAFETIMKAREPFYTESAQVVIETDHLSTKQIVAHILLEFKEKNNGK